MSTYSNAGKHQHGDSRNETNLTTEANHVWFCWCVVNNGSSVNTVLCMVVPPGMVWYSMVWYCVENKRSCRAFSAMLDVVRDCCGMVGTVNKGVVVVRYHHEWLYQLGPRQISGPLWALLDVFFAGIVVWYGGTHMKKLAALDSRCYSFIHEF